ncbi:BT_3987 domain-containing protein [Sphingobacterium sp. xlx-130]|uniref:BT_3987 domain-containing protein n=1 Tax=Sphingobacterium sp. xlx-130 TaxID=2654323 RepID=UPI0013D9C178|nr:DUF1735 domain-containing protein [Sphingobacterium sp. xlx-130]
MKIVNFNITPLFIYVCIGVVFLGCKKNEIDHNILEYVSNNISAYDHIPINSGDNVIINMDIIKPSENTAGFKVFLKEKAIKDMIVSAEIDYNRDLISAYDSIYLSNSPILTDGLFEIEKPKILIKAGDIQSTDSVTVNLKDISSLPFGQTVFVVPIKLITNTKGGMLKSNLMFVRFKVNVVNLTASVVTETGDSDASIMLIQGVPNKKIPLQVRLNQGIDQNVHVVIENEISNDLVAQYNSKNNTNYLPFPKGSYILHNTTLNLNNNQTVARGLELELVNKDLFTELDSYILPVRVNSSDAKKVLADPKKGVFNFLLTLNNISKNSKNELNGEVINREKWKAKSDRTIGPWPVANLMDGNNSSFWIGLAPPDKFEIDMGQNETVKGFKIVPNYTFGYRDCDILEMDVFSSIDGVKWKHEGRYFGSITDPNSNLSNPDIKIVKFNKPVTARHFRYQVLMTTLTGLSSIAEINAIK